MVSVMLYPCMFCVALSMDLFVLCVAVFDSVSYFVVECDVMELLSMVGGALLDRPYMVFQRMCPFHMFCSCFCMSEVISSFIIIIFI